jgi:hypothetical protein
MSVTRYAQINIAGVSLAAHPVHYICTTTAELPPSGLKLGDTALALDTNVSYKAASSTTWAAIDLGVETFTKGMTLADPTAVTALTVTSWVAPFACTVTAIQGYRVGGTGATVQAYRNTTASPIRSAALSLTSALTWMPGGAVQNTSVSTGNSLMLGVLSTAGSPTEVSIQLTLTRP